MNGMEFFPGENVETLQRDLKLIFTELMKTKQRLELLKKVVTSRNLKEQWDLILKHPNLDNLHRIPSVVIRVSVASNAEAGCEQSNSKYNRAKNKYSTAMKLPMIKARMRVGSNGPTIHQFNAESVLEY